jgi:transcriptional regulator with XRE-family HTH domain
MKPGQKRYADWKDTGFPRWLQERMAERGWNARRLATEIDVVPSLVSRWMTERQLPSDESLRSIAHAMHLPEVKVFQAAGRLSPSGEATEDPKRSELLQKLGAVTLTHERYLTLNTLLNMMLETPAAPSPPETLKIRKI